MSEAFLALWASTVRTIVPVVVGFFLQLAVTWNLPLDQEFESTLTALLTLLLTTAYYVAVRLFETYISPKLGWLLGYAKSPDSYSTNKPGQHSAAATLPEGLEIGSWTVSHDSDGRAISNVPMDYQEDLDNENKKGN